MVEKDGERCSEDFPYEEHGMEVRTTAAGAKKIYVKVGPELEMEFLTGIFNRGFWA